MRLDFNVLWVDDQPTHLEAQLKAIAAQMENEGFQLNARQCRSIADIRSLIAEDVFTDEIDLVVVDWDLGGGVEGQDAIAALRDAPQLQYKDVVFYSALNRADELRRLAFERGVEGVYCVSRAELVDEVIGVFDSLVKKVLDLDHTRGIVMGATSDIDHMIGECLVAAHGQLDDPAKKAMVVEALGYIEKRVGQLNETLEALKGAAGMEAFFEAHSVFTANDKLRVLGGLLQQPSFAAQNGYRPKVVEYQQKVLPGRNMLGHVVLVPTGKPTAVVDGDGKEVSLEEMRELRRLILGLRGDFRGLLGALQSKP